MPLYEYPAWFVDGALTTATVGYAPRYATPALSESLAVRDASARRRAYRGLRIRAEAAFAALGGSALNFAGERMQIDTLGADERTEPLATADAGRITVALVGDATGPLMQESRVLPAAMPDWIRRPPPDAQRAVAVGISGATYREENCWDAAEWHGVQQLAASVAVGLRTMAATTTEGQEALLDIRTDVELRDIHVVSRWRDERRCAVLMRATGTTRSPE